MGFTWFKFTVEEKDEIFKFFDIIGEKNMDHVNYNDSLSTG